jgi:hypothetical protein
MENRTWRKSLEHCHRNKSVTAEESIQAFVVCDVSNPSTRRGYYCLDTTDDDRYTRQCVDVQPYIMTNETHLLTPHIPWLEVRRICIPKHVLITKA